ncbi:DUF5696 domain-containing protein [Paenibacillus soyae]|uniref:DUF5696 domain-containing protein n=1 Tax=Paenibacillus soyae TaxID=2969249 RepID=A0A9X2S926_9BACL|nr:DUF5696 domain-containing protein [Paenibacillus soyae]MCR2804696.1 DUF5696 domain-containing protein [Paenibacillus soyae]
MKQRFASLIATAAAVGVLLLGLVWLINKDAPNEAPAASAPRTAASAGTPVEPGLPNEAGFELAGETGSFRLWADEVTGHFKVESKTSGRIWRSYPEPAYWEEETAGGVWKSNFLSPVMLEYIDASSSKSQTKLTNWMEERGTIEQYERIEGGFRVLFRLPASGFDIPVEVRLAEDYVEVKVIDSGIQEGAFSLLNLKAYPQFGAQPSKDESGYLLLPDGSGSLVRFDANRSNDKSVYREPVYGADLAFYNEVTNRNEIRMPVFGLKSGEQSFLGVMTEGEAYAKLFAAPAGSLGTSNWVSPEWQYRIKFFQNTDRRGTEGFYTFSKERFEAPARSVRYYLLEGEQIGYDAMAARYRQYLVEEKGLERLQAENANIPFYTDLIAADLQQGVLWDDYIVGTTTEEAEELLSTLGQAGISNITAIYHGWQKYGYSSYGGLFPADKRIGGGSGIKELAEAARANGGKLLLAANYSLNNSGRGGFWSLNDGLRNLAGTLQEEKTGTGSGGVPIVSPLYSFREAKEDLASYQTLGVDGVLFTGGIGSALHTDYNNRNRATRAEVQEGQRSVLAETEDALGLVAVEDAGFYSLPAAKHVHRIADDYSYDIFVDEAVPFAQIALHGLATYTLEWGNLRDEYEEEYLRSAEYGAYPAYVFANAPSESFKKAYTVWYYSLDYRDWIDSASEQYKKLNDALGKVQDQFITKHGALAPGVKATTYENGVTVVVNYNDEPFEGDGYDVPARDFAAIDGEGGDET